RLLIAAVRMHSPSNVRWFVFSSRRRHTRSKRDWSSDVCSSDLGQNAQNIKVGNTLSNDQFLHEKFDYMITNPPYGVEWKPAKDRSEERRVGKECRSRGARDGRNRRSTEAVRGGGVGGSTCISAT